MPIFIQSSMNEKATMAAYLFATIMIAETRIVYSSFETRHQLCIGCTVTKS
jgi:hypothetical protein